MERPVSVDIVKQSDGTVIGDWSRSFGIVLVVFAYVSPVTNPMSAIGGVPNCMIVIVANAVVPGATILNAASATAIRKPRLPGSDMADHCRGVPSCMVASAWRGEKGIRRLPFGHNSGFASDSVNSVVLVPEVGTPKPARFSS